VASHYPEKTFHFIEGYCPIHNACSVEDIKKAKELHPEALVAAHPECGQGTSAISDFVGSTTGILDFCRKSGAKEFIIGTENEIVLALKKEMPEKIFYPAKEEFLCKDMKKNTLAALLSALENEESVIELSDTVISLAKQSLEKMINL
jgi:quinolinate synthase